jgi:hypothetical protein
VDVRVRVGLAVTVGVDVRVRVGLAVTVGVDVRVRVGLAVTVGVDVRVRVGLAVTVGVNVMLKTAKSTGYETNCQSFANAGAPLACAFWPFTRKLGNSPLRMPAKICPATVSSP